MHTYSAAFRAEVSELRFHQLRGQFLAAASPTTGRQPPPTTVAFYRGCTVATTA